MLTYIKGDLVRLAAAGSFDIVIHGANCFHTMGSGVAKQLVEVWPSLREADVKFAAAGDPLKLGYYSQVMVSVQNPDADAFGATKALMLVNGYTQYNYGADVGVKYVEYCAVANVFNRLASSLRHMTQPPTVGIPRIGCGRAGGDWSCIERIIGAAVPHWNVVVVDLPQPEIWRGREL